LSYARERRLTVRRGPTSSAMFTVELPKGELLIEVVFENGSPHSDPRTVSAEEWFITARDPLTSEELWNDRFSYREWSDVWVDAQTERSSTEWFEDMGNQLIAFLEAVLTNEVQLARVATKPLLRLFGWRWPHGEKAKLQLLIDGEWIVWNHTPVLFP